MHKISTLRARARVDVALYSLTINSPEMNRQIVEQIDQSEDRQNRSTNVNAHMTDWKMMDSPGFSELAGHLLILASRISNGRTKHRIRPRLKDLWGVRYQSMDSALCHGHWPCTWACVYYIDPPANSPGLRFPELQIEIQPTDGLLLMFDGWLKHEVPSHSFEGARYAVAGNLTVA